MLVPSESREVIEMRQLAIVAHELRNPLAAAWCAVRKLGRTTAYVPEVGQALPLTERRLGYIARIVDDLVDVASVASGKLSLQKERVDLSECTQRPMAT
jgi:two-component system CheB/CheR fusion protein